MADHFIYDEKELLLRIAGGDTIAFRQFFDTYWKKIFANAQQFTKDTELARDLAQEVFIKIWVNKTRLTEINNLEAYLYAVARNLFFDTLKKKVLDISNNLYLDTWFEYNAETAEKKIELKELETSLNEAIMQLPPQMQTAFRLSRVEGLTHEQIAVRMQISKTTSKSYIVRALIMIRKIMAEKKGFDDILLLFLLARLNFF